jgi:heme-degrading monooxygenase HmoA
VVGFLAESVQQAVLVEFDRYIAAGDLAKTEERIQAVQSQSDSAEGFVGMYL